MWTGTYRGVDVEHTHLAGVYGLAGGGQLGAVQVAVELSVLQEEVVADVNLHRLPVSEVVVLARDLPVPRWSGSVYINIQPVMNTLPEK